MKKEAIKGPSALKRTIFVAVLMAGSCVAFGLYTTQEMRRIDTEYRDAIERQATAAYVLANANRFLVSERDDIAEMLVDNTAAGSATDLELLRFDQTNFAHSLGRAMQLVPNRDDGIEALQKQADHVIDFNCKYAISLGALATQDAAIIASQQAYLKQCAPYFPSLVARVIAMQELIRNERNSRIAAVTVTTRTQIHFTLCVMLLWVLTLVIIVFYCFRPWLFVRSLPANDFDLANPTSNKELP